MKYITRTIWILSLVSLFTDKKDTATAIGTYSGFQSICTMLASLLAGLIWYKYVVAAAFMTTAIMTILVIVYFLVIIPSPHFLSRGKDV